MYFPTQFPLGILHHAAINRIPSAFVGEAEIRRHPVCTQPVSLFYGWVILAAAVVGTIMSIPGQAMGVGVFTDFWLVATGLDRLSISTAYMFGTIASSLGSPNNR